MRGFIFDFQRFGYINNSASNTVVSGTSGDDSISISSGSYQTVYAYNGSDTIYNGNADYSKIYAGDGNDSIKNWGIRQTIDAGAGNDTIYSYSYNNSINGGTGNDSMSIGSGVYGNTINGGGGNDIIYGTNSSSGNIYQYSSGDGNDIIYNFGTMDTLQIGGGTGTYSTQQSGSDIIVTVGNGKITLNGAASSLSTVNIVGTYSYGIKNYVSNTVVSGTSDTDSIYNYAATVTVNAGTGDDRIDNRGNKVTVNGGTGNDLIWNDNNGGGANNVELNGDTGNDDIYNFGNNVTINGGAGDDSIKNDKGGNAADSVSVDGGTGNDFIFNFGNYSTLKGGTGNDTIGTYDKGYVDGELIFENAGRNVKIYGGDGNDSIYSGAKNVTINGGTGNDYITLGSSASKNIIEYTSGDGSDIICGFNETSTLSISSGSYSTTKSGSDVIVTVGDGKISLKGAASLSSSLNIAGLYMNEYSSFNNYISSDTDYGVTYGTDNNDRIYVSGAGGVYIYGKAGNDSIKSEYRATIDAGDGNDTIVVDAGSIYGGAGNDIVTMSGNYTGITINGGKGNDTIYASPTNTYGRLFKYVKGDGNDYISGFNSTDTLQIGGGTGTYSTVKSGSNIVVTVGDGKITLVGAALLGELNIDGDEIVTEKNSWKISGSTAKYGTSSNTLVTVNGVKSTSGLSISNDIVTVSNASLNKKTVTISSGYTLQLGSDVTKSTSKGGTWAISGSTATYKSGKTTAGYKLSNNKISYVAASGGEILTLVNGVKSTSGLSISNDIVTVSNASLNKKAITISSGYTLQLGDDVTKSTSKGGTWAISGSTATYKSGKTTAGYKLSNNKISYVSASGGSTLTLVNGVKSTSGLSISNDIVTVSNASLNKKAVTISSGYTLQLGSDVTKSTSSAAKWSISGSTATYKSGKTTAGYKLSNNKISYVSASGGSTLTTVKGVKSTSGLSISNDIVTVSNASLNKKAVTISSGYKLALGDDVTKSKTTAAKWSLSGSTATYKSKKTTAGYKLASNKISYVKSSGGANLFKISGIKLKSNNLSVSGNITSGTANYTTSGNDVVFTVGKGKITVKGAADKTFTYTYAGGTDTYSPVPDEPYTVSGNGKGVTLSSSYAEKSFDVSTISGGSKIVTINAYAVKHGIDITGNGLANSIVGGKGNDTLDGGSGKKNDTLTGDAGADVFFYVANNGNEVITDYKEEDTIVIKGTVNGDPTGDGRDITLNINGGGKITLRNADKNNVGITYFENNIEHDFINGKQAVIVKSTNDGTIATIGENYWKNSFDIKNFAKSIQTIDATVATISGGFSIKGDKYRNWINGSYNNDSIDGGEHNDTIHGYAGDDTLIGGKGNDTLWGGDGKDVFVYSNGDGDDTILDYNSSDDMILIKSGTISDGYVNAEGHVVLKIGSGSITIQHGKSKIITTQDRYGEIKPANYSQKKPVADNNLDEVWFMEDDTNYASADNQLSEIIRDGAEYSTTRFDDKFTFTAEKSSLPALTYSAKK